jgi:hypothetical protein
VEITFLEILGSLICVLLTGAVTFMVHLNKRLRHVEEKKIDKDHFQEVKDDIKRLLEEVLELKLEHARWQGKNEAEQKNKPERS